jgi:hypothetical protein
MTILPVVIFDDIELWATGVLRSALGARSEPYTDNVYVSNTVPDPRRDRMVIVRRDGGGRLDAIREAPRLGINVWATTEQDATDLGRMVAALLWASPDGDPVSKVTVTGGPYPVPDESTQFLRYITAELISHGRDAA